MKKTRQTVKKAIHHGEVLLCSIVR